MTPDHDGVVNLHATTVVVGEAGVIIGGSSGAGKTRLALAMVAEARRAGRFAAIVADDRSLVTRYDERLVARPHPALAGLVERRGMGVGAVDHEPACVLVLAVDLVEAWPDRWPESKDRHRQLCGVALARLALGRQMSTLDAVALISADLSSRDRMT